MSVILAVSVMPMLGMHFALAEETDAWDFCTIRNFTGSTPPSINDTTVISWGNPDNLPNREYVRQYTPNGTDWSLKLTAPANETKNLYYVNLFDDNYAYTESGCAGMRMWIANPSDRVVNLEWQYISGSGDRIGEMMNNREYYLQSEGSDKAYAVKTRTYLRTNGNNQKVCALDIPAGYTGWLYVPYGIFNYGQKAENPFKQIRLFIYPEEDSEVSVYTSRIDYYNSGAVTPVTAADYDFDSMIPYTNSDSADVDPNKAAKVSSGTVELDTAVRDGNRGQSLKVTYTADNPTGTPDNFIVQNFCEAFANDSADGISFWTKNSQNEAVTLTVMAASYQNIKKNAPYYIKPDGAQAYTAYTGSSPFDNGARATITVPAGFEGRIYIPYSDSQTYNNNLTLKQGMFCLTAYLTEALPSITMNFDSFRNYNFEEIGALTTTTFDNLTSLDGVMWSYSGYTELSAEDTDGGTGKSVKAKISSSGAATHRFRNLAPSTDIATYNGRVGYRFWISNPNNFDINASTQFFEGYQRSYVGREYVLVYEKGGSVVKKFQPHNTAYPEVGCITIPANFRGYVYISANDIHNSANYPVTELNAWTFVISFLAAENDGYIYLDSYGMYTEEPAVSRRQLPTLFSDGVLFQQNKDINVWGFDLPEREITARLYKGDEPVETVNAVTNSEGRFELSFSALCGSYDKYRMEISDTDGVFGNVNDILIGELWLAGGQSNMEFTVGNTASGNEILENASSENLRVFIEPKNQSLYKNDDVPNAYWINGTDTDDISKYTSAVALVFAYRLEKELKVPVGIINSAIGSTRIYEWFGREATMENGDILQTIKDTGLYFEPEDIKTESEYLWTRRYNTQIAPLEGLNIAGTIWYQGESDNYRYQYYAKKLDFLKESWGKIFGFENDSMPFIYTQVAPYVYNEAVSDPFRLGYLAEAMTDAFKMNEYNNTAMLTIYDVPLDYGDQGEIHPNVKIPVGERFAQAALNMCYGGAKEASAPIFSGIEIKGNAIYVSFTHTGDGLSVTGEEIRGFNIAGEDGVYVNARAKIVDRDTVMVWNDNLKAPKNVTYAFASMNQASNLVNSSGIPASPFRSDRNAATYMTLEEWMFADADAWECAEGKQSGIKNSWTVSDGAAYSYSETVKTEGKASLAVTCTDTAASVSPVINTYRGKKFNLASYKSIKLDVKANAGATVSLVVNGEVYGNAAELGNDDFNTVTFALDTPIADKADFSFAVSGLSSGVFYIDNIAVGMTEEAAVFGDVNDDGELTEDDVMLIRRRLLDIKGELNTVKCDANNDGKINIADLVRVRENIKKLS